MAKQIKMMGRWVLLIAPLVVLAVLLVPRPKPAQALTFSNPWWSNVSSNLECFCSFDCGSCGGTTTTWTGPSR